MGIWFNADDPDLRVYEDFNQQFGQKEWSLLLLRAETICEPIFLRDLAQISARIEKILGGNFVRYARDIWGA